MSGRRRSEMAAEAWRQRYVNGVCSVAEMEAGIARALAGECSDAEWVQLASEHHFRQPIIHTGVHFYDG